MRIDYFHTFNTYILKKTLLFLLIVLHAAVLVYAYCSGNVYMKDSVEYMNQAYNLKHYASWYCGDFNAAVQPELYSMRPPLYGFFLMIIQFFSENVLAVSIIQSLLSIFNLYIAIKLVDRFAPSSSKLIFILAALFFFPSQLIYSGMIMSEMLLQFFIMCSAYFLILYIEKKSLSSLVIFQLAVSCALLTKPVFIAFPVLTIILFSILPSLKSFRGKALYSCSIPVVFILLISFNNYKHTGYFEYSSITRKLSINYHAFYSVVHDEGNASALLQIDSVQQDASQQTSYSEKAEVLQSGAGRLIGQHLDSYIFLTAKGIFLFFVDHSRYDLETISGKQLSEANGFMEHYKRSGWNGIVDYINHLNFFYLLYLFIAMLFNALLLFGLIRFTMLYQQPLFLRLVITGFILYLAVITGMTGTTRFRLPVFPLLLTANLIALKYYSFPFIKKRTAEVCE